MKRVKKLHAEYHTLEREVKALSAMLVGLLLVVFWRIGWLFGTNKSNESWAFVAVLGALVSALLIAKVATRQIAYSEFNRQLDGIHRKARLLNRAIGTTDDIIGRVEYLINCLTKGQHLIYTLSKNAAVIESRWEVFFEPEIYEVMGGDLVGFVNTTSGQIFGLTTLFTGIEKTLGPELAIDAASPHPVQEKTVANLRTTTDRLKKLRGQLAEMREELTE